MNEDGTPRLSSLCVIHLDMVNEATSTATNNAVQGIAIMHACVSQRDNEDLSFFRVPARAKSTFFLVR